MKKIFFSVLTGISTPSTTAGLIYYMNSSDGFDVNSKAVSVGFKKNQLIDYENGKKKNIIDYKENEEIYQSYDENEEFFEDEYDEEEIDLNGFNEGFEQMKEYVSETNDLIDIDEFMDLFQDLAEQAKEQIDKLKQKNNNRQSNKSNSTNNRQRFSKQNSMSQQKNLKSFSNNQNLKSIKQIKNMWKSIESTIKSVKSVLNSISTTASNFTSSAGSFLTATVAPVLWSAFSTGISGLAGFGTAILGLGSVLTSVWSWVQSWFSSENSDSSTNESETSRINDGKKVLTEKEESAILSSKELNKNILVNLDKLADVVSIKSLKTVEDFKLQIIDELKKQTNFNDLTADKVEIKKIDGLNELTVSDLVGEKIKVRVSSIHKEFIGIKFIDVYWTEETNKDHSTENMQSQNFSETELLSSSSSTNSINVRSVKTVENFKLQIINTLQKQTNFIRLGINKIEVKKADKFVELTVSDLVEGKIEVRIDLIMHDRHIESRFFDVYWTEETNKVHSTENMQSQNFSETELLSSSSSTNSINVRSVKTVENFKLQIINTLQKQTNFIRLGINKIEVKKADKFVELTVSDLVEGKIEVRIDLIMHDRHIESRFFDVYWTEETNKVHNAENIQSQHFSETELLSGSSSTNSINSINSIYVRSVKTVENFKSHMINELKKKTNVIRLEINNIKIKKAGEFVELTASDLVEGKNEVRINLTIHEGFTESILLDVNWTEITDKIHNEENMQSQPFPETELLSSSTSSTNSIYVRSVKTVENFKSHMINELTRQTNVIRLGINKIEVKKADKFVELTVSDLVEGKIEVRIDLIMHYRHIESRFFDVYWTEETNKVHSTENMQSQNFSETELLSSSTNPINVRSLETNAIIIN